MHRFAMKVSSLVLAVLASAHALAAQQTTCDLKLKVYAFDAIGSPKSRVGEVRVRIAGKGAAVVIGTADSSFNGVRNLKNGKYQLEFSKAGYMKRRKQVEVDCGLVDKQNAVWNNTYLRREKNFTTTDADLMDDASDDSEQALNNAGITGMDVSQAAEAKLTGQITIEVVIDEDGNVLSASHVSGDKKLAEKATYMARRAKFEPAVVSGVAQRVKHNLTYNFGS